MTNEVLKIESKHYITTLISANTKASWYLSKEWVKAFEVRKEEKEDN
jgi:hypothetical protein